MKLERGLSFPPHGSMLSILASLSSLFWATQSSILDSVVRCSYFAIGVLKYIDCHAWLENSVWDLTDIHEKLPKWALPYTSVGLGAAGAPVGLHHPSALALKMPRSQPSLKNRLSSTTFLSVQCIVQCIYFTNFHSRYSSASNQRVYSSSMFFLIICLNFVYILSVNVNLS